MTIEGEIGITEDVMHKITLEQYGALLKLNAAEKVSDGIEALENLGYVKDGSVTEKGKVALKMKKEDIIRCPATRMSKIKAI